MATSQDTDSSSPHQRLSGARASGPLDMRAVWQLTSMSVGAGMFTIPKIFVELGTVHAMIWVVLMGALANLAMQRLLDAAEMYNLQTYECLAERAFGNVGKIIMVAITLICTFIATLSYVNTAKDLLVDVATSFILDVDVNAQPVEILDEAKTFAVLALLVGVILPSVSKPTMGSNAWISKLGVVTVFFSATFFIVHCFVVSSSRNWQMHDVPTFAGSETDIMNYVATLAFSYSMVFALFPVLEERCTDAPLSSIVPTLRRPVLLSVSLCCMLYLVIGLVGAYSFGGATKDFSLRNLPMTEPLTQLITLMMGASVELLVVIVVFPTVQSLMWIVGRCFGERGGRTRLLCASLLAVLIVFVDAFLQAKAAFALCGALGLSLGAYVMPCFVFYGMAQAMSGVGLRVSKTQRFTTVVVLLFGLMLLFGATPVVVSRALKPSSGPPPTPLKSLICDGPMVRPGGGGGGGSGSSGFREEQRHWEEAPRRETRAEETGERGGGEGDRAEEFGTPDDGKPLAVDGVAEAALEAAGIDGDFVGGPQVWSEDFTTPLGAASKSAAVPRGGGGIFSTEEDNLPFKAPPFPAASAQRSEPSSPATPKQSPARASSRAKLWKPSFRRPLGKDTRKTWFG